MSMVKITCPSCKVDGWMSLLSNQYDGPYSCWKCHTKFRLVMQNGAIVSCDPMSQEEFDREKEMKKQRDRLHGGAD